MKVLVQIEVEDCKNCPYYEYGGTSWGEDFYTCKKSDIEVEPNGVPNNCPFIPSTDELLKYYYKDKN